mmetsp:Transcript_27087/g.65100  ORF Transcript_27087/g.65100 Transcript_27087/m.65100 type:complete len:130 (+) Transcript_27087:638-1027(+)
MPAAAEDERLHDAGPKLDTAPPGRLLQGPKRPTVFREDAAVERVFDDERGIEYGVSDHAWDEDAVYEIEKGVDDLRRRIRDPRVVGGGSATTAPLRNQLAEELRAGLVHHRIGNGRGAVAHETQHVPQR